MQSRRDELGHDARGAAGPRGAADRDRSGAVQKQEDCGRTVRAEPGSQEEERASGALRASVIKSASLCRNRRPDRPFLNEPRATLMKRRSSMQLRRPWRARRVRCPEETRGTATATATQLAALERAVAAVVAAGPPPERCRRHDPEPGRRPRTWAVRRPRRRRAAHDRGVRGMGRREPLGVRERLLGDRIGSPSGAGDGLSSGVCT